MYSNAAAGYYFVCGQRAAFTCELGRTHSCRRSSRAFCSGERVSMRPSFDTRHTHLFRESGKALELGMHVQQVLQPTREDDEPLLVRREVFFEVLCPSVSYCGEQQYG